jgi:hypothetical protein
MMSLWNKLPTDIIQHIYVYDSTYRERMNESLKFVQHACPTCCCDGGKKTRYRHYGDLDDDFWPWSATNWEWRRRNACPKHNSSEFDKNGFQTEYDFVQEYMDSFVGDTNQYGIVINNPYIYFNYEIRTGRTWYRYNETINYNFIMLPSWVFCTHNKDIYPSPIKTYSSKKLTGARFMDMTHTQRPIAV